MIRIVFEDGKILECDGNIKKVYMEEKDDEGSVYWVEIKAFDGIDIDYD